MEGGRGKGSGREKEGEGDEWKEGCFAHVVFLQMLAKQLPLMQTQTRSEVEGLAMYMPSVHSALQRRELALYNQLADSFHQYAQPCVQAVRMTLGVEGVGQPRG